MKEAHAVVVLPPGAYGRLGDSAQRQWLSRGSVSFLQPRTEMLSAVLQVIGLPIPESGLAALRFWGQTGERSETWMAAADPVHFETRLRHIVVRALCRATCPSAICAACSKCSRTSLALTTSMSSQELALTDISAVNAPWIRREYQRQSQTDGYRMNSLRRGIRPARIISCRANCRCCCMSTTSIFGEWKPDCRRLVRSGSGVAVWLLKKRSAQCRVCSATIHCLRVTGKAARVLRNRGRVNSIHVSLCRPNVRRGDTGGHGTGRQPASA